MLVNLVTSFKIVTFAALTFNSRIIMAIPVRSFPVLEGEVAERFEKNARWAEEHRGSVKIPKKYVDSYNAIIKDYHQRLYGIS
ncbi:hypothetical protein AGMMS50239_36630 [Bacteroidia bacterium]|nr:hypothetical protein AGMMS50239_36630 [Bacteroidia bacterium]